MSIYHIYSLPAELLQSLVPRNSPTAQKPPSPEPTVQPSSNSIPTACNICLGAAFSNLEQQRAHYRSDWHRYNVKNRLNGSQPISEFDFTQLIDGMWAFLQKAKNQPCLSALEDSLSGSESSSDEGTESDSERDAVSTLISKHKTRTSTSPDSSARRIPRTALSWFHSPPSTQIGVYRTLFPHDTPEDSYLEALKDIQTPISGGRRWAMFMVAGGHFAGAVVRVSKAGQEDEVQPKKQKKPVLDTEVLRHKTFHRYTS